MHKRKVKRRNLIARVVAVAATQVALWGASTGCRLEQDSRLQLLRRPHSSPGVEDSSTIKGGESNILITHQSDGGESIPPKNFGNEIIYQVVVDRFANGNPNNDCLHGDRFCSRDRQDWFKFWGGDIRGLIDHADYLKTLGVTRLWVTPIFENQLVVVHKERYGRPVDIAAYHGYWIRDWFKLNPFFTDNGKDDLGIVEELVNKFYPETKIYLDTVVNHTSPRDATRESLRYLNEMEPLPVGEGRSHRGAIFENGKYVTSYDEDLYRREQNQGHIPLFHHNGVISDFGNRRQLEEYSLEDLADVDQRNVVMQDYFRRAHDFWLERVPLLAGYRMDSIKHVNLSYWQKFSRDLYSSNPGTEVFGEYFGGSSLDGYAVNFYRSTRMSMLDFGMREALRYTFFDRANGSFKTIVNLWQRDGVLVDGREMITFLDNHDIPRLRGETYAGRRISVGEMKSMVALWFASRGIPCIYYGLEQDLFHPQDIGDPYNRPMMENFDTTSEMFTLTRKLVALRKQNAALRYGATHVVHLTHNILAFERLYGNEKVFFAVSKNPRTGTDMFSVSGLEFPSGDYEDVLTGVRYRVENGIVNLSMANGDVVILSTE